MPAVIAFDSGQLEGICRVLEDTDKGLTGSEIEQLLRVSQIPDPQPSLTKHRRSLGRLANKTPSICLTLASFLHPAPG